MKEPSEKTWHSLFELSLIIKAFDGLWQIVVGLTLWLVSKQTLSNIFFHLAKGELIEDPKDRFVAFIIHIFSHVSSANKTFAGSYLFAHGALNLFLVIALYKEKLWAYWVSIVFSSLFIAYELFRFSYTHGLGLLVLSAFDCFFIFLTYHEYNHHVRIIAESKQEE